MTEPGRDESVVELRPAPWWQTKGWREVRRDALWAFVPLGLALGLVLVDAGMTLVVTLALFALVPIGSLWEALGAVGERVVVTGAAVELYRWRRRRPRRRLRREHLAACRLSYPGGHFSAAREVLMMSDREQGLTLHGVAWEPVNDDVLDALGLDAPVVSLEDAKRRVPMAFPWSDRHPVASVLAFVVAVLAFIGVMVLVF